MSDFSIYPDAIDGYAQLPLVVDNVTRIDAVTVNRLRSAIVNIEKELGELPRGLVYETVGKRLDAIEESIEDIIAGGSGSQGPQGERGFRGFQGFQGDAGATGSQGAAGSQGFQGNTGVAGSQGFQGFQGNTGLAGFQGFQGAAGAQGFQGDAGAAGATGAQGFQGDVGATGATGSQGDAGAQGFQGDAGATGSQGFQGDAGAAGAAGAQGFQGAAGAQGTTGAQGDSVAVSLYWKDPCLAATTSNITLTGGAPNTVDGVNLSGGSRILVNEQTTSSENGIYEVQTLGTGSDGTWIRTSDMNTNGIFAGSRTYIQEGSNNSRTIFTMVTTGTINFGTTSIEFIQEAPLVRTDTTSTTIKSANFSTSIDWSSAVKMRDHKEISVWIELVSIGSNTEVFLYAQWLPDEEVTIPYDDNNGNQQTDFLLTAQTDGTYKPKDYVAKLTTETGELVTGVIKLLSFPKKGGVFRFGVKGNNVSPSTGSYIVKSQRLA